MATTWIIPSRPTATSWTNTRRQIGQLTDHYIVDIVSNKITDTEGNYIIGLSPFLGDQWTSRTLI